MKNTFPFLTLLALAGTTVAPASSRSQEALRVDTAGNPTGPLNLGSSRLIGTLVPARLGTGTPTSATVLRGDGSWAGTTATGATIPSSGSLLMGDSAGNALPVLNGANLERVLRTRLENLRETETPAVNLLPNTTDGYNGFYSGTLNADGTITVPPNGNVAWRIQGDAGGLPVYAYAVATSDQPAGAITLHGNYGADFPSTDSTVAPGVYRSRFLSGSSAAYGTYNVFVRNTTGSPVTIYYPVASYTDTGLTLLASHADVTPAPPSQVSDLDFTRLGDSDRPGRSFAEKQTTLAADSVGGVSINNGSLWSPKASLSDFTITNGSVVGLARGSMFRDSLVLPSSPTQGVVIQDTAHNGRRTFPVISGLDTATNGSAPAANGDGTYTIAWNSATISNDGYNNVYVVEINTAAETTSPVASRRRMTDVGNNAAVQATAGSVYVTNPASGQWRAVIHPSDNLAPGGASAYRYEVVARVQPANWGTGNSGDGTMSGVELVGGSSGYGSLGGPANFIGDRLAILHATTHGAVIGGGALSRSVFYEMGDLSGPSGPCIQLAWFADDGSNKSWDMRHGISYGNVGDRLPNFVISHVGGGSNYARGDISDWAFVGARWSDGSLRGTALDYVNVNAGTIERVYVQGVAEVFGNNMPAAVEVKNSVFRQVNHTLIDGSFHDNLIVAEDAANAADVNHRQPIGFQLHTNGAAVANNLIWSHGVANAVSGETGAILLNQAPGVTGSVTRNILVCDPQTSVTQGNYFQGALTAGTALDYNLVIFTGKFYGGGTQNNFTWDAYRANNPTLDQHSLFIDLSADPRGLKAVFADPANGDFRWAQTDVARRCAAYCQANHVGPAAVTSHWPFVPAVDEAVRLIAGL